MFYMIFNHQKSSQMVEIEYILSFFFLYLHVCVYFHWQYHGGSWHQSLGIQQVYLQYYKLLLDNQQEI